MRFHKSFALLLAAALAWPASSQSTYSFSKFGGGMIPSSGTGGAPGGTSNPANAVSVTRDVIEALTVDDVDVAVDLTHSSVGDLRIEISHCGTTVILYQQAPSSFANLSGVYDFDDEGPATFATAVGGTPPAGTVPPGSYVPANSLAAFDGMSTGGPWTVTVYDLAANETGSLLFINVVVTTGKRYLSSGPGGPIPDGSAGQCLSPVVHVISVPDHGPIGEVRPSVQLTHSYVSDLDITIAHGGVSVTLSAYNSPNSSGNLAGYYSFADWAPPWVDIEAQTQGSAVVPNGFYQPKEPLAAFVGMDQYGLWFVTVCDRALGDTGTLGSLTLDVNVSPWRLTLSQPNGLASVAVTNVGGKPGGAYANLFTLDAGIAPFGWLAGLDIGMADVLSQLSFGAPFAGLLGPCGSSTVSIAGPIPSGLAVWMVGLEFDGAGVPVAIERVKTYTTL